MISVIFILFFKASLTIRLTATVSQKKSGTSKKVQWDFQISWVGSLDFLDLKVNGSPVVTIFSMKEIILGYRDVLLNVSRGLDPEWFYTDALGYFMRVRLYGSYYI